MAVDEEEQGQLPLPGNQSEATITVVVPPTRWCSALAVIKSAPGKQEQKLCGCPGSSLG